MSATQPYNNRLGRISYLNVLPIYYAIENNIIPHHFDLITGHPKFLNQQMFEEKLDISAVSSLEYAHHPDQYFLIPNLSVSSIGTVDSVKLFSQVTHQSLEGQTIAITNQSQTSVALLKVILQKFWKINAYFQTFEHLQTLSFSQPVAMLCIGNDVFHVQKNINPYSYRYDLGKVWHDWTGLPFVFAVWIGQRSFAKKFPERFQQSIAELHTSKKWGLEHIQEICQIASQQSILNAQELMEYYSKLIYDLREQELFGLSHFFDQLCSINEIDRNVLRQKQ